MAGVGPTTLFKYYKTKENPIVAISAAARSREWALAAEQCGIEKLLHFTAYEMIRYYTDWIICLYLSRPELLRFADRTEPSDYLMSKSDVSWGQDTARPFIMDNDKLMDGWRSSPDSGSSALGQGMRVAANITSPCCATRTLPWQPEQRRRSKATTLPISSEAPKSTWSPEKAAITVKSVTI